MQYLYRFTLVGRELLWRGFKTPYPYNPDDTEKNHDNSIARLLCVLPSFGYKPVVLKSVSICKVGLSKISDDINMMWKNIFKHEAIETCLNCRNVSY